MFSADVAYAAFEDADRGAIAVGKRADFTILSQDPTAVPPSRILDTKVVMTIVGGRAVHEKGARD
jgi:predicted amidohydrolase YtcJ